MTSIATALMGFFILSTPQASWTTNTKVAIAEPQAPAYELTLTGYNAVPEQTDDDPLTTASGAYSNPEIVAARSVDLAKDLPFGTVIKIEPADTPSSGCGLSLVADRVGLRVIADSMNPRMHDKIDLLFAEDDNVLVGGVSKNAARTLGVCRGAKVTIVGKIDILHMPKTQAELKDMIGKGALALAK